MCGAQKEWENTKSNQPTMAAVDPFTVYLVTAAIIALILLIVSLVNKFSNSMSLSFLFGVIFGRINFVCGVSHFCFNHNVSCK